ncbi:MAG TPA: phosphate ABC transporter substrate-binding protein PstS [Actinomycetota bacterium]|nr:phosphate ABC transporter substrate-binding protein PstS [Actinomycetota bacterium]
MTRLAKIGAALATVAIVGAACGSSGNNNVSSGRFKGTGLTGAGSTFAQPMYAQWANSFNKLESAAKVNYQAIGSGGGVEQFTAKTVDFGATDVPLQSAEISAVKGNWLEFPTALGGVAVVYNVQGVQAGLKLDGPTVGDIFAGKVKAWNDPEIANQNAGVSLPNTPITPVVRAEDSGTTAVFSGWMGKESSEWTGKASKSSTIFPSGVQKANGNAGVAAGVKQSNGTIGYVSYDFAVTAGLSIAQIKSPSGAYVAPSIQSITAAGGGLSFPIGPDTNILDSSAPGAYPIASTTYVLIYTDQTNEAKAQTLVDFWHWALTKGQSETNSVNYAPLPSSVAQGSLQQLAKITDAGTPVKPSANA